MIYKYLEKLYVRVLISLVVGVFLALSLTKFQGSCTYAPPGEDISRCVQISKVFMYPDKIFTNSDIRTNFLKNFATVFIVSFSFISVINYYKKTKKL